MPTKHSKNNCDNHHYTYGEKKAAGLGSIKQRLGSDSQLPFGYCPLSLAPISDAAVSPSGHIYSRESILEYLLTKTQELKAQARAYELQQVQELMFNNNIPNLCGDRREKL
jgi:nitric oxide synthase-interacting protein